MLKAPPFARIFVAEVTSALPVLLSSFNVPLVNLIILFSIESFNVIVEVPA